MKKLHSQQKPDMELTVAQIHELVIAKFRLKLKKVGKTTRPFTGSEKKQGNSRKHLLLLH